MVLPISPARELLERKSAVVVYCTDATLDPWEALGIEGLASPFSRRCTGWQAPSAPELPLTQTRWTSLQVRVEAFQAGWGKVCVCRAISEVKLPLFPLLKRRLLDI